jgi:hypothetical protein
MARDSEAQWFVSGGDDYFPDPTKRAEDIAQECAAHFAADFNESAKDCQGWTSEDRMRIHEYRALSETFGVMQPTGDRWGEGRCTTCNGVGKWNGPNMRGDYCDDCQGSGRSATIDRIAGSPWIGREFARRAYHGGGPLYNGFYHNFADEHLQCIARKLGVFWQRRDLTQEHRHWARLRGDWRDCPPWAKAINDPKLSDWDASKALFAKLKAGGFREADDLLPA